MSYYINIEPRDDNNQYFSNILSKFILLPLREHRLRIAENCEELSSDILENAGNMKMLVVTWHALDQSRCVLQPRSVPRQFVDDLVLPFQRTHTSTVSNVNWSQLVTLNRGLSVGDWAGVSQLHLPHVYNKGQSTWHCWLTCWLMERAIVCDRQRDGNSNCCNRHASYI